ncbi:transposase [Saccharopolyspora shandongensis]|uniref:transposase n=1 Tax=Saccharopolyspora shandongensis TaxID=418495 RepID=UPI0033DE4346
MATDTMGLLLAVVVTAACIQDRDGAHRLLAALRARFSTVSHIWADCGYTGRLRSGRRKSWTSPSRSSNGPARSADSSSYQGVG